MERQKYVHVSYSERHLLLTDVVNSFAAAQVRTLYHFRGGSLQHVAEAEHFAALLNLHSSCARYHGIDVRLNEMCTLDGFRKHWRHIIQWLGMPAKSSSYLMRSVIEPHARNITLRMRSEMILKRSSS